MSANSLNRRFRRDGLGLLALLAGGLVALSAIGLPRVALLGGYPATDEGVYAFAAQWIHHAISAGRGLPDDGPLNLYPALLSWVFGLGWNHLLTLRLLDLIAALGAGWLLYLVLLEESGSVVAAAAISATFMFAMNQHVFVQHGFKNSMFAAYVPLFAAALIGLRTTADTHARWWLVGALVAAGVLLRETFVHFAVIGLFAVAIGRTPADALRYALGGIIVGTLMIGGIAVWRGGLTSLLESYVQLGAGYSSVADLRWKNFLAASVVLWDTAKYALLTGLAGLVVLLLFRSRPDDPKRGHEKFWIAVALVPLLEPIAKFGFPYHLAVSLVGLSGLVAIACRRIGSSHAAMKWLGAAWLVLIAWMIWPQLLHLNHLLQGRTMEITSALREGSWPEASIERSNYLSLARAVRNHAEHESTLSISGSALVLFPLSGLLPPTHELHNLSDVALQSGMKPDRLRDMLQECPPDIIVLTTRTDIPGRDVIAQALSGMPEYREVAQVPVSAQRDYGQFGGSVLVRSPRGASCDRSRR
jgi:hypothetical protein